MSISYSELCFVVDVPLPDNSFGRTILARPGVVITRDGDVVTVEAVDPGAAVRGFPEVISRDYGWHIVAYAVKAPEPVKATKAATK